MNIDKSIMCLRIYDEGRFISMELRNCCKEARIKGAYLVMSSCNNSYGKKRLCYLLNWSPSVEKDSNLSKEVWIGQLVIIQI
jgi:hypothetical protein